jgi:AcrR family transcriptional regulator
MYRRAARSSNKKPGKTEAVSAILRLSEDVSGCKIFRLLTMAQKRTHSARRKPHPAARRKPRADAQRNRERILEVAKQAFTRSGADTSLDDIATQAGVGAGTLYRHFPTREALLAAVYRTEVEKLAAAEKRLADELAPLEALRAWMLLFVDYIATKKIIAPALNAMLGEHSKVIEAGYAQIQGAIRALVKRAIDGGEMRSNIEPVDLLKALVGVGFMSNSPDWQQSARRLVDILINGSRSVR